MDKIHQPAPRDWVKTLEDGIKKLRYETLEHIYIINPVKKKQIRKFIGTKNCVNIDDKYAFEMKNRMVIHNHPNGCSFSIDDIQNIIWFDAFIFHVITEDSIYTVKRPESGWKISVDFKKEPRYQAATQLTRETLGKMVQKNEISSYYAEMVEFDYIWSIFFHLENIEYVRKKIN